jgi:hypothetical protein
VQVTRCRLAAGRPLLVAISTLVSACSPHRPSFRKQCIAIHARPGSPTSEIVKLDAAVGQRMLYDGSRHAAQLEDADLCLESLKRGTGST